jgi:hypothetical protein
MTYDRARRRLVLFGGSSGQPFGDTWEWDGTDWQQRTPVHTPPARYDAVLAYDSWRQRTVLFGGAFPSGSYSDTWEWDGTDWAQRNPVTTPPGGFRCSATFDAVRGRTVLAVARAWGVPAETWEWDGSAWIQRPLPESLPELEWWVLAYDAARERTMLTGYRQTDAFETTWECVTTNPAGFTTFGQSCPGSAGSPRLAGIPEGRPWIGGTARVELTSAPASTPALLVLGFSDSSWNGVPLPLPLAPQGAPLCQLLVGPDVFLATATTSTGGATVSLPVPGDPAAMGLRYFQQFVVYDPGANALGSTFSNGGAGIVGAR